MDKESRYIYKAKRKDNGEWVKGYLFRCWEQAYILWGTSNDIPNMTEVDPDTICQSTGYRNVFENDIFDDEDGYRYVVEWSDYDLTFEASAAETAEVIGLGEFSEDEINVKGNTFDNPELLE